MRKAWILAAVLAAAVSGACSLKNVQEPEKAGGRARAGGRGIHGPGGWQDNRALRGRGRSL